MIPWFGWLLQILNSLSVIRIIIGLSGYYFLISGFQRFIVNRNIMRYCRPCIVSTIKMIKTGHSDAFDGLETIEDVVAKYGNVQ